MKITELKDKIVIAELDPEKEYIVIVNPIHVHMDTLKAARVLNKRFGDIPVVISTDIDKSLRFVEIPKKKEKKIAVKKVIDIAEKLAGKEK